MLCRGWESINYALFGASLMGLEILRQRLLENREKIEKDMMSKKCFLLEC